MSALQNVKKGINIKYLDKAVSSSLFWVSAFAVLTFLAAQVSVPVRPVPFTLQTMLVVLSGAFLGARKGAYSQLLYLAMGAAGLPVFANFSSFPSLLGPTAGYLLAFPLGAYIAGAALEKKRSFWFTFGAMAAAVFAVILTGTMYLSLFVSHNLFSSFFEGAVIFTIWDLIKISAAASIYHGIAKKYAKLPL